MIPITILQTSDMDVYEPMLRQTSQTVREYKNRVDCQARIVQGIYRGFHPWHAVFNRIFMISELLAEGIKGWAIYLDADAYIYDLNFDVRSYLEDKSASWAIMTPGTNKGPWDVNDGVMIINLEHDLTPIIIARWKAVLMAFSDDQMRAAKRWGQDGITGDQAMLQSVLRADTTLTDSLLREKHKFMNSSYAQFIRQMLRADEPDLPTRIARITAEVKTVLEAPRLERTTLEAPTV